MSRGECVKPALALGLAATAMLALGACGPLIGFSNNKEPSTLYTLEAPTANAASAPLPVSLMVEEPAASDVLDSRRIALKPSPLEVQYYAGARWTDRAPSLVQRLLATALASAVSDVSADRMPLAPDYRLQTRLVDFQTVYAQKGVPVATVTLELKLFSRQPSAMTGLTTVHSAVTAASDRMPAIIEAFNAATKDAVTQAATWTRDQLTPKE